VNAPMPWHDEVWRAAVRATTPALLMHGPQGIGERAFVLALAEAWLCESADPAQARPCGTCPSCRLLAAGNHPDLRLLEPEAMAADAADSEADTDDAAGSGEVADSSEGTAGGARGRTERKPSQDIRVDRLRELADLARLTSHRGGARVVIIHPVEAMNAAAANALLKLLEEPPAGLRFVLVTHRLQRVSATVRSRCMRVPLPLPARDQALQWLRAQGVEDAEHALALAGGAPQAAHADADPVRAALFEAWLRCVGEAQPSALAAARATRDAGAPQVLAWLLRWTHDLARVKAGAPPRYHSPQQAVLQRCAQPMPLRAINRLQRTLLQRQRWIRHPLNPQLTLEALWLDYLQALGER
jgi:DNA polymerase III subunit delta'